MIEKRQISIRGLPVEVVRKSIKNLHLGVYQPHGRVRVAAPLAVSDEAVRLAVIGKLGWIKRQRERFEGFTKLMDRLLPPWRLHRAELNRAPLGHATWRY